MAKLLKWFVLFYFWLNHREKFNRKRLHRFLDWIWRLPWKLSRLLHSPLTSECGQVLFFNLRQRFHREFPVVCWLWLNWLYIAFDPYELKVTSTSEECWRKRRIQRRGIRERRRESTWRRKHRLMCQVINALVTLDDYLSLLLYFISFSHQCVDFNQNCWCLEK